MSDAEPLPELKEIVGSMLFVSKQPLSLADMRRVFVQVAEIHGGITKGYARVSENDIRTVVDQLRADLAEKKSGLRISEVANGYRLENDSNCGPWLRHLLERGRPTRLSRPALETLAIIAYRQPVVRSEIEAVRGVQVDQIIRNLLEMQLIRIMGRSELPGRPWQFGTTQKFLEHFGLKSVNDLPGVDELRRMENDQIRREEAAAMAAVDVGAEPTTEGGEGPAAAPVGGEASESSSEELDAEDEEEIDEEDLEEEDEEDDEDGEEGEKS
jgi:segregation and condensation protein B